MTGAFNEAALWPAFLAAGVLVKAIVKQPHDPSKGKEAWVEYTRPDYEVGDGAGLSAQHSIEYQHCDLPSLAEGTELLIEHTKDVPSSRERYQVRQSAIVEENGTGFFRRALLTRIEC